MGTLILPDWNYPRFRTRVTDAERWRRRLHPGPNRDPEFAVLPDQVSGSRARVSIRTMP